jgi:hypothetical protein
MISLSVYTRNCTISGWLLKSNPNKADFVIKLGKNGIVAVKESYLIDQR